MRTLFHRLGAGALLAGSAMLGGCLSTDKPAPKYNNIQKPVNNTTNQAANGQPGFGPQQTTTNNAAQPNSTNFGQANTNNQFRTNNFSNTPADPNPRIGMTGGPVNPAANNAAGTPYNGIQPAGGVNANPGTTDLRPIGTNVNNSNSIKPIMAGAQPAGSPANGQQPTGSAAMPQPDPPPVSMQNNDRDLNNLPRMTAPGLR